VSQFRRYPLHGRAPAPSTSVTPPAGVTFNSYVGRRMLPVVVKDVAGLVPGAYKGRGKGNRFLADVCDADVLVHVVDVTGQADRDGNAIIAAATADSDAPLPAGEDKGSSPMEDAEWIREELHRWIYGNVRGKWNSVLACTRTKVPGSKLPTGKPPPLATQQQRDRAAQRVLALFTGYQGPRWCVELAAERAGLVLELAGTWVARDLHRVVAHFLSIRFPVCLALNKIDSLGKDAEAQSVITHCQETARLRGEAAVPVSARAECWILNKQAAAADVENLSGVKKPSAASAALEESICKDVLGRYGTTGVLEVRRKFKILLFAFKMRQEIASLHQYTSVFIENAGDLGGGEAAAAGAVLSCVRPGERMPRGLDPRQVRRARSAAHTASACTCRRCGQCHLQRCGGQRSRAATVAGLPPAEARKYRWRCV